MSSHRERQLIPSASKKQKSQTTQRGFFNTARTIIRPHEHHIGAALPPQPPDINHNQKRIAANALPPQLIKLSKPRKTKKTKDKRMSLISRVENKLQFSALAAMLYVDSECRYWYCTMCRENGIKSCGVNVCKTMETRRMLQHCTAKHHVKLLSNQLKEMDLKREQLIIREKGTNLISKQQALNEKDEVIAELKQKEKDGAAVNHKLSKELHEMKMNNKNLECRITAQEQNIQIIQKEKNQIIAENYKLSKQLVEVQMKHKNLKCLLTKEQETVDELNVLKNRFQDEYKVIKGKYDVLKSEFDKQQKHFLFGKDFTAWNCEEVIEWLCTVENCRFNKYETTIRSAIKEENIKGEHLMDLDKGDLHRLGITDFSDKKHALNHIQKLYRNKQNDEIVMECVDATVYY